MKKMFLMAASAAMILASCDKAGGPGNIDGETGRDGARMGIAFTIPTDTFGTRAVTAGDQPGDDQPGDTASAMESAVNSIEVWIFQNGKAVSTPTGGFHQFTDIENEFTPSTPTTYVTKYTLKAGNEIATVTGLVDIYVAANTPSAQAISYATVSDLLAAVGTIDWEGTNSNDDLAFKGAGVAADAQFTMFSEIHSAVLDEGTNPAVEASLERVVSKIQATKAASISNAWGTRTVLGYEIEGFAPYNYAAGSYLIKKADGTSLYSSLVQGYSTPADIFPVHASVGAGPANVALGNLSGGAYIGENDSTLNPGAIDDGSTKQTTTFVAIATVVTPTKVAKWETDAVVWVDYEDAQDEDDLFYITARNTTTGQFYDYIAINHDGADADADDLIDALLDEGLAVTAVQFYDRYVHFQKWLNGSNNDYIIGRNQFIHVDITGIAQGDGLFPGRPGVSDSTPNVPGDMVPAVDEPVNIEVLPADLLVNVTVQPWVYKANSTVLGE